MAALAESGLWIVAFLTEVNFTVDSKARNFIMQISCALFFVLNKSLINYRDADEAFMKFADT